MKRGLILIALALGAAAPASAQFAGMPVWNSPKGGTGITISGDYGKPDSSGGKGSAFGARASTFAGDAAFRVVGGSLIPIAINVQVGAGTSSKVTSGGPVNIPSTTAVTGAVGISASIPSPGISIEPYFSPGMRYVKYSDTSLGYGSYTKFGFVLGANVGFGMVGLHVAYDYQTLPASTHRSILGIGAHVALKVPGL